jgi:PKD repeat protein
MTLTQGAEKEMRKSRSAFWAVSIGTLSLFFALTGIQIESSAQSNDSVVNERATETGDYSPMNGNWYGGIWKNTASSSGLSVNLYIQSYYTDSMVVVYTPDARVFHAFLSETSDSVFEADSMDPGKSMSMRIDFLSEDAGTFLLTDNTQDPPSSVQADIERVFQAVRTAHSGIWKDATDAFNMYVQDYETGSTVIVYTFDGSDFRAFLSDTVGELFSCFDLGDGTEEMTVTFTGWGDGTVTVQSSPDLSRPAATDGFAYDVSKRYPPALMDVDFEGTPRAGAAPLQVMFSDTSTLANNQWSWDFGDGDVSGEQDPTHVYTTPGKYTVRLTSGDGSVEMTTTKEDYVQVFSSTDPVVSGNVLESYANTGLKNVSVTLGGSGVVTTDATGHYAAQVPTGWSGILGPSLSGWVFTPRNMTLSNVTSDQSGQDFLGSYMPPYMVNISGKVVFGGAGLGLVQLDFSGVGTCFTDSSGNYSYDVPDPWTGTVTPSMSGYYFSPASKNYTAVTTVHANQDFSAFISPPGMVTVGGAIKTVGGTPLLGVVVNYSGTGGAGSASVDIQGRYSFQVLSGWSGAATPTLSGYTFSPASRTYTNQTTDVNSHDYTASVQTVSISGSVTFGGSGLGSVVMTVSDVGTVLTDASGFYDAEVPIGWTGTVTPSLTGYFFTPASNSYTSVASSRTNEDFSAFAAPPPMITVSGTIIETGTGNAVNGVDIDYSGVGGAGTAVTNPQGEYSFQVLSGWSGTATPSHSRYTFYPPARMYNSETTDQSNHDYTATPTIVSIVGQITTSTGTPISGVSVDFGGGGVSGSVATGGAGGYSFDVPYGWSGTATPSFGGYSFSPTSRSYTSVPSDQFNQNYTGTQSLPQTVTISGTITYFGDYLSGVTVTFSGAGQTTTDTFGHFVMDVPYLWSGAATPSLEGYTFSPEYIQFTNVSTDLAEQNFTASQTGPQTVVLSGTITGPEVGAPAPNITVSFSGQGSVITDEYGFYYKEVPTSWSGAVTPSYSGYGFDPPSYELDGVSSDQWTLDFTAYLDWFF